jgi:uncharacterized protein involved in exopolysaccharide biosynthesis
MDNSEISLIEILGIFRDKLSLIFKISCTSSIIIIIFFLFQKDQYISKAVLINPAGLNQSSSSMEMLGGLAGLNLGGATDKLSFVQELIKSRSFLAVLSQDENFKRDIFAADSYSKDTKVINYNSDIYDFKNNLWKIKDNDGLPGPTLDSLYKKYLKSIDVNLDISNDTLTVEVSHVSPNAAYNLLKHIISSVNSNERERDLAITSKKVDFLKLEIAKTRETAVRDSVSKVFQNELANYLIAKNQDDYVVRSLDPPFLPEKKSYPNMMIISLLSIFLSFFLTSILIVFKELYISRSQQYS